MMNGSVVSLHICRRAEDSMTSVPAVRAVPGKGLEQDRYHDGIGTFSTRIGPDREVTLIEEEAIQALRREYGIAFDAGDSRRNIVTRGVPLNHCVGREFHVGEVTLRGIRLCEPCGHLERVSGRPVRAGLVHRAGLRAQIVTGGIIRAGDRSEPVVPR